MSKKLVGKAKAANRKKKSSPSLKKSVVGYSRNTLPDIMQLSFVNKTLDDYEVGDLYLDMDSSFLNFYAMNEKNEMILFKNFIINSTSLKTNFRNVLTDCIANKFEFELSCNLFGMINHIYQINSDFEISKVEYFTNRSITGISLFF